MRNATAAEIATFGAGEEEDDAGLDAEQASRLLDHPQFGKLFAAVLEEMEELKPAGQRRDVATIVAAVKTKAKANMGLARRKAR